MEMIRTAGRWTGFLLLITLLLLLPLAGPLRALFSPGSEIWRYFAKDLLWLYARDTALLGGGVLFLAAILGVLPAWILSRYSLPSFLETALILPLALPAYITAYAYSGIFDFYGPLWRLGEALGFPAELLSRLRITNMPGLILVMSFALYPYVFIIMRNSFRFQVAIPLNVARSLGAGEFRQFFGLSLPLCRPALVAALGIVLMEVLNEYGAVSYFGQNTLSTGIFRAWFGYYDLPAAQRLGGLLIMLVFVILVLERVLQGQRKYDPRGQVELEKIPCSRRKRVVFFTIALLPALLGFFLPLSQLIVWALRELPGARLSSLFQGTVNTIVLALLGALVIMVLTVLISFARRMERHRFLRRLSDLSLLGHSIPGSVIALGIFGISQGLVNMGVPVMLSGSIFLLIYAYVERFLALSQRSVSATMSHQLGSQDEVSRSLGHGPWQTLLRIHLPNLKMPLIGALSIVFLELIKELPLTIILRPFNFQTLAVRSYQLASSEMVQEASIPALILVGIALLSVLVFQRRG